MFALLLGILVHGVLTWNPTFNAYSRGKRLAITAAIVFVLGFLVLSILYLLYGKGSNSTSLGF